MKLPELVSVYKASDSFHNLKETSKATYLIRLQSGMNELPDKPVKEISAQDADQLYLKLKTHESLHKAVSVCVVLRKVWNTALRYGYVTHNPFARMGLGKLDSRTVIWSDEYYNDFTFGCVDHGVPSLALLSHLCYYLAQRPGDMRQLLWDNYIHNTIRFTQEKTGTDMICHVPPELKEILDTAKLNVANRKNKVNIVVSDITGKPFTKFDYSKLANEVKSEYGIPMELQLRDLRRTAETEGGEQGLTDAELQALTGNKSRDLLQVYQIRTARLNESATNKRFKNV